MRNENPNRHESAADRKNRIPMLRLEKYLLDELSPEERARLEGDAARNPRLAASLAEMRGTHATLDWQGLRARLDAPSPTAASKPAPSHSLFTNLAKGLADWTSDFNRPKLAWVGACAALLLLAPVVFFPLKSESGFRAKGHSHPEVVLEIGGSRLAPGQKRNVQAGDILGFSYRSVKPLYTQIWYREDGGAPSLFDGRSDSSLFWPASSGWSLAPQRIRLEGDWKVQRVIIVASPDKMTSEDARRIILGDLKPANQTGLFTYDLLHP